MRPGSFWCRLSFLLCQWTRCWVHWWLLAMIVQSKTIESLTSFNKITYSVFSWFFGSSWFFNGCACNHYHSFHTGWFGSRFPWFKIVDKTIGTDMLHSLIVAVKLKVCNVDDLQMVVKCGPQVFISCNKSLQCLPIVDNKGVWLLPRH